HSASWGGSLTGYVYGLQCRECRTEYLPVQLAVCESCFGPLEVRYEIDAVRAAFQSSFLADRPHTLWRYREFLPVFDDRAIVDLAPGYTPLRRAKNLESVIGTGEIWIKDDTVNPTYSFKDRPVAVAIAKAREWSLPAVGCASTGNLAAAPAAAASKARITCFVFAPASREPETLQLPMLCVGWASP